LIIKLGYCRYKDKNTQFIASMITRELCNDILSEMDKGKTKEALLRIVDLVSRSNKYIYIAQHFDLNVLTIENLNRYIGDESLFMETYQENQGHIPIIVFSILVAIAEVRNNEGNDIDSSSHIG
jgi:hypothetical protein